MKKRTLLVGGLLAMLTAAPWCARADIYVAPTGATESNYDPNRPAADTINGSGLSDPSLVATGVNVTNILPAHNVDSGDMWRTANGYDWSGGAVVTYTLGAAYDLTGMHVWNYNENWSGGMQSFRGVKNLKIEYQAGDTNWMIYTENMELAEASSSTSYTGTNYPFSSTLARVTAVRFTCLTNWAENFSDRIGLSEVRFIAITPQVPLSPVAKKLWINGTTAKLYWDVGAGATNYMIKRSETPGTNYVTVANVAATNNAMEYWSSNLVSGATYYYVIVGENTFGESSPSTELSGTATDFTVFSDGGGTWNSSIYTLPEAVFDGDTATAYDGASSSAWVGIDLGAGNERACPAIDFHPRTGNESRMNGAQFQGSIDGFSWDTLAAVSGTPPAQWNRIYAASNKATDYRYFRCYNAVFGNVAEIRFLTTNEVEDVIFSTSPVDGETDVAVDAGIVVTATDIKVDFNALISSYEMLINSNAVSGVVLNSATGITTFTYAHTLAYDTEYAVHLNVVRTDGVTNTVDFSFTTIPDYDSGDYLIAPGIRNGGFELVEGASNNTTTITDFALIDNWSKLAGGGKAGTAYSTSSPEGERYMKTDRYFKVVNLTDHVIAEGDRFDFEWITFGRPAGVIVGLCYSNAVAGITNIVASEVTAPDGNSTETKWSGSYAFGAGDPAIGSTLGLMIQDLGNSPTNDTSTTEAYIDRVHLLFGQGPSVAPVVHLNGVDLGTGTVSLMWDSESGVIYHILSKPNLASGIWVTNATVSGDGSTIMTNVATGAYDEEFFRLEAQ